MKQVIARAAKRLGYTIVPNWRLPSLAMATKLQQIFTYFDIETVIDVGANEGQYAHFMRHEVGFTGRIESFEPIPELCVQLQAKAASDALWSIHECALGAERGELPINVMENTCYSSFLHPAGHQDKTHRLNRVSKTQKVPVQTLDVALERVRNLDLSHAYLKLDTQGYDLEVLKGGVNAIRQIPALQTEISVSPLYNGMPNYAESISQFEEYGFRIADFFLVCTQDDIRAMEFDCIFVR